MPGPQNKVKHLHINQKRSSLKFGPIFCPKLGEEQKKRSSLKFRPIFCPKLGEDQKKRLHSNLVLEFARNQGRIKGKEDKNFGPKLDATTSTLPGPLSPGPPRPVPAYDVPPEPPSRRPLGISTSFIEESEERSSFLWQIISCSIIGLLIIAVYYF